MTISSGFFNSVNGDRLYNAADMNMPYKKLISNGVIPETSSSLQVMAGNGLTVNVQSGSGLFGDGWCYNNAPISLTVDSAHPTLDRIDLVVMRRDDNEDVRNTGVFIKKGTPASVPRAPEIERSTYIKEYALAEIYVSKQVTEITQSKITDTRADTTRCGWTTSLINQVDTSTLFAQWQVAYEEQYAENTAIFEKWWESVKKVLQNDESAATQILLLKEEKADRKRAIVTLASSGWSLNSSDGYYYQTVVTTGIQSTDILIVSATPADLDVWSKWGIVCTAQDSNSVTFRSTAAVNVTANIVNLG